MTERQQTFAFADQVDKLVARFAEEFDMSYSSVVGVLQFKIWQLCEQAQEQQDGQTEGEPD